MNNEPVAWMSQGGDVTRSKDYFEEMGFKDLIPLYTHPVKELTDEEIIELGDKHLVLVNEYIGCGDYVSNIEGEISRWYIMTDLEKQKVLERIANERCKGNE